MRKITLIFVLAIFIHSHASTQTCLPEGILFSLQQDINDFTTDYPNCTEIEGDVTIRGGWDLDSLYKITSIGGFLSILDNDQIDDFIGLDSLTTIGGYFKIFDCEELVDLSGLESLTNVGGNLEIAQNDNLDNLSGLSSLSTVGGQLQIKYNYKLNDITGLLALTSIGNSLLHVQQNHDLTSLHGLDNIDYNTINDLYIFSNTSLTDCSVKSVCDYISNSTIYPVIYNNDPGCNSQSEVEELCGSLEVNENSGNRILISPNPADNIINISLNGSDEFFEVITYNSIGQKNRHQIIKPNKIDVSRLSNGIYIIELRTKDMKYRQKLIIKR